ncbi:hypothetical protein ACRRTK_005442 [Alexandromys fortis]
MPQFGLMKVWSTGDCDNDGYEWEQEICLTEKAVEAINKLNPNPKFFDSCIHVILRIPWWKEQTNGQQQILMAIDQDIAMVLVSDNHDLGNVLTAETMEDYCQMWRDNYFTF